MTKFNFDLSNPNPFSTKMLLTPDDIIYLNDCFSLIAEFKDHIPDNIFSNMGDIQKQFLKDNRLSQKQIDYVSSVCEKYCSLDDDGAFDESEDDYRYDR